MSQNRKDKAPLEDFIADAIREAVERGEFENLKGKGKPLRINADEMINPTMLANKLLKNADFPPPWATLDEDIKRDAERAEQEILRAYRSRQAALLQPRADAALIERRWQDAIDSLRQRVDQVNSKILKFNITIPPQMPGLHKPRLRVEQILEKYNLTAQLDINNYEQQ